jgi:signal peptidase I
LEQPQLPATEPEASPSQPTTQGSSLFREIVETLLLTVVIFVLVNAITGRFRIDGSSMEPNLHDGEYVIVNRVVYRLQAPQRGDVVVFQREGKREFIKRIIGLPGETVEVKGSRVLVNGVALTEPYIAQPNAYSMEPRKIGPNEYFVLGDNRNNSSDSHNWGTIPLSVIDGKAWITYWPPKSWGIIPYHSYTQAQVSALHPQSE